MNQKVKSKVRVLRLELQLYISAKTRGLISLAIFFTMHPGDYLK